MSFIDTIKKTTSQISTIAKKTYGPLSVLEIIPEQGVYRYPLDVGNSQRFPHTVEFQTWLPTQVPISEMGVVQATQDKTIDIANKVRSGLAGAQTKFYNAIGMQGDYKYDKIEKYVDPYDADMMAVDRNKRFNDRLLDFKRRATRSDVITMYMPQGSWNDRINNSYNEQSMTAAMGAAGGILEVGSAIIKGDVTTHDMINGPAGMELLAAASASVGMDASVMTDAGLNAIGYALNPQFEMLYNGTNLREFQFDFTMTPRSSDEARMVNEIIRKFKYHGSPAFVAGQGRYIVPPSYFDITFKFNGTHNDWLPEISTCVLKSFDTDYTGGLEQWATFKDGSPIQVRMVLVFAELEMMHKSLRKKGY